MRKKYKNYAFTAIEAVLVIAITCFIGMILIMNLFDVTKNADSVKFKTANLNFKTALDNVLSDPILYSQAGGLADLSEASDEESKTYSGETKFRDLMFKKLEINPYSAHECMAMMGNKKIEQQSCFQSENGVLWHIPNTDFVSLNMVQSLNATGSISNYVPVTIYPSQKAVGTSEKEFQENAVIMGVRRDGATTVITTVDCEVKEYKDYNQCKFIEYLTQANIRY